EPVTTPAQELARSRWFFLFRLSCPWVASGPRGAQALMPEPISATRAIKNAAGSLQRRDTNQDGLSESKRLQPTTEITGGNLKSILAPIASMPARVVSANFAGLGRRAI